MSYVTLQVGQCGNQLGRKLFDILSEVITQKQTASNCTFLEETSFRFFSESSGKHFARSVLIDTEPKVIDEILRLPKESCWSYRHDCAINVQELGSGNNWAMGYYCNGPAIREIALNAIRKEVERCDYLMGFLQFSSAAGGTGSGLGSHLSELLQDEFPSISTANITVWPFQKGDVTIQAYNSVLSLASLQKSTDAIFLFENDCLLKLCRQKMGLKNVSLYDLNAAASQQIANLFLPAENKLKSSSTFNDMLAHLVPHPQYKIVSLRSVPQEPLTSLPFSAHAWSGLLRSLRRIVLYNTVIEEVYGRCNTTMNTVATPPVSMANLLVLRGRDCETADVEILHKPSLPYASWIPNALRLETWSHSCPFLPYDRTAVLANNGQLSTACIDTAVAKAWKMFSHNAFFHHYEQCGLTREDFKSSVMAIEQMIASYNSLTT